DNVDKGEGMLEVERDKVKVEVVCEEGGVLSEEVGEEGDRVEVGEGVGVVGEGEVKRCKDSCNEC
uniref:biotin/lipoyl-containing protein n=1 Tax=Staphylococcus epidermidis TaxID=1282 RepID=UPI001C92EFA7